MPLFKRRRVVVGNEENEPVPVPVVVVKEEDPDQANLEKCFELGKKFSEFPPTDGETQESLWGDDADDHLFAALSDGPNSTSTSTSATSISASDNPPSCETSDKWEDKTYADEHNRHTVLRLLFYDLKTGLGYLIQNQKTKNNCKLFLKDCWSSIPELPTGTRINIVDVEPDKYGNFTVQRDRGFFIIEPDRLVSVTSVAGQAWCERKVALSEIIRFPVTSLDTLRGNIAHELTSRAMLKKLKTVSEIADELNEILKCTEILEEAYGLGLSQSQLNEMGQELVPYAFSFNKTKVFSRPPEQKWNLERVIDIEDCYWNPQFGIKGKVDCVVEATNQYGEKMVVPLELKTGNPKFAGKSNPRVEHIGQLQLYTLLMRSVYESNRNNGLLYYIRENHLLEWSASLTELQCMIVSRNKIVLATMNSSDPFSSLPAPGNIQYDRQCKNCEYRNICSVALRLNNEELQPTTDVEKKLTDSVKHLQADELAFFSKWMQVLYHEVNESIDSSDAKNLWLKPVASRTKEGKCLGPMRLIKQKPTTGGNVLVTFGSSENLISNTDFMVKDFVILGTFRDPCISYAYVESIVEDKITLLLNRELQERHQQPGKTFCIDKISSGSPGMKQFADLSNLMNNTSEASRFRNILLGKYEPAFSRIDKRSFDQPQVEILKPFNRLQKKAIVKSLTTDSLLLVKGSPGCGKTCTIVGLMRLLVARGKTVLVVAYTNNAVDNILLSYKDYDSNFIRLGSGGKLCEDVLMQHTTASLRKPLDSVDHLADIYNASPVVAATLMNLRHPIFSRRKFDYCIVDEGSQALPTTIFGVLQVASKIIIFGDPNQLPAIVKSNSVKEMKIEDNAFALITRKEFYCNLSIQYRMNQHIMQLANELLYDNAMRCANLEQATDYLVISGPKVKEYLKKTIRDTETCKWLCLACSRRPQRSVIFLDTKEIKAYENVLSSSVQNAIEKDIVITIAKVLIEGGLNPKELGVIAPYRGQVSLIREALRGELSDVEVNTVDQYQGREKNCVIVSFTKSTTEIKNAASNEMGILNDVRRLNVAITRAKAKVILIGNSLTLKAYPACDKLLSLLNEHQRYSFKLSDLHSEFFNKIN